MSSERGARDGRFLQFRRRVSLLAAVPTGRTCTVAGAMGLLLGYDDIFRAHNAGPGHPERPERLDAVLSGVAKSGVAEDFTRFSPRPATRAELERVHDAAYLDALEALSAGGGGRLDPDTSVVAASYDAACRAAGAGLGAVERLRRDEAGSAFLAVRPPGHHALAARAMGFCIVNNLAVTAAALLAEGERVLVLDWDAHHGNGTQAQFYGCDELLFVSWHQAPFYPGTGGLLEIGSGPGEGYTLNLPLPAGTGGDAYRLAFDEAVVPAAELFSPTWLLVSVGFDAHRDDPLTDMGLSAGDFGDLAARAMRLAPPGRRIFFLEGGYDASAIELSAAATAAALAGEDFRPERQTSAAHDVDPAAIRRLVEAAHTLHEQAIDR